MYFNAKCGSNICRLRSHDTLSPNIDAIRDKITKRTKAIILVYPFGYAIRADRIKNLSKKYNFVFC